MDSSSNYFRNEMDLDATLWALLMLGAPTDSYFN